MLLYLQFALLASAFVTVSQPEGPYSVSLARFEVNDTTRTDPYTGKPFRVLPFTIITPSGPSSSCHSILHPYMTNATAHYWEQALTEQYKVPLQNTFSQIQLSLCEPQRSRSRGQYPLIFFSPGLGFPNEFYSILTTNIAAQGYTVIQVDNPGEISFIEFPDGSIEYGSANITDGPQHATAQDIRVKDISFVLDRLSTHQGEIACMNPLNNSSSPSIFGHSFGGATALATLISDHRFVAGGNEDGAFWGEGLLESTDRAFMILASTPNYTRGLSTVPNWAQVWPHLQGPKWLASIDNTTHNSFVDIYLIAEYLGLFKIPGVRELLGEIDPAELLRIQVALLSEMGKFSSGTASSENITTTAAKFDEVHILNGTLTKPT